MKPPLVTLLAVVAIGAGSGGERRAGPRGGIEDQVRDDLQLLHRSPEQL